MNDLRHQLSLHLTDWYASQRLIRLVIMYCYNCSYLLVIHIGNLLLLLIPLLNCA